MIAKPRQNEGGEVHAKDSVASAIAKWLVPSATVLFGLVGYSVETAQEQLLRLGSSEADSRKYFDSAADFICNLVTTSLKAVTLVFSAEAVYFGRAQTTLNRRHTVKRETLERQRRLRTQATARTSNPMGQPP